MEYLCELVNLNKYIQSSKGIKLSLCNSCCCGDCTNPIEYVEYSVYGITKRCKAFQRGPVPYFVIACNGYMTEDQLKKDEDQIEEIRQAIKNENEEE